jgi:hypothetical protein
MKLDAFDDRGLPTADRDSLSALTFPTSRGHSGCGAAPVAEASYEPREPSMGWLVLDMLVGTLVRNGLVVCFELIEFFIAEVFKGIWRLFNLLRYERRDHADIRGRVLLTHPV